MYTNPIDPANAVIRSAMRSCRVGALLRVLYERR
jgi:hypothetical protein